MEELAERLHVFVQLPPPSAFDPSLPAVSPSLPSAWPRLRPVSLPLLPLPVLDARPRLPERLHRRRWTLHPNRASPEFLPPQECFLQSPANPRKNAVGMPIRTDQHGT